MFSILDKTISGLKKTRNKINNTFSIISKKDFLDEADIDTIEEILLQADLGWEIVDRIVEKLSQKDDKNLTINQRVVNIIKNSIELDILNYKIKKIVLVVGITDQEKQLLRQNYQHIVVIILRM